MEVFTFGRKMEISGNQLITINYVNAINFYNRGSLCALSAPNKLKNALTKLYFESIEMCTIKKESCKQL